MTNETTTESMSKASDTDETAVEPSEVNEDEPAKIRIRGSNECIEFDIGSSFTEDEIIEFRIHTSKDVFAVVFLFH